MYKGPTCFPRVALPWRVTTKNIILQMVLMMYFVVPFSNKQITNQMKSQVFFFFFLIYFIFYYVLWCDVFCCLQVYFQLLVASCRPYFLWSLPFGVCYVPTASFSPSPFYCTREKSSIKIPLKRDASGPEGCSDTSGMDWEFCIRCSEVIT